MTLQDACYEVSARRFRMTDLRPMATLVEFGLFSLVFRSLFRSFLSPEFLLQERHKSWSEIQIGIGIGLGW